ncbi:MAG: hypothetical protein CM1200mP20_14680 [Pseudomonadota bacterium]|nr:MAG: hypothetical protein CM1200mP20_14680 [Pseudomonadota bacterium]
MTRISDQREPVRASASSLKVTLLLRMGAWGMVSLTLLFLFNNYLIFWMDWPGPLVFSAHQAWFGLEPLSQPLDDQGITRGWIQIGIMVLALGATVVYAGMTPKVGLRAEADRLSGFFHLSGTQSLLGGPVSRYRRCVDFISACRKSPTPPRR